MVTTPNVRGFRVLSGFLRRFVFLWPKAAASFVCGAVSSGLQILIPLSSIVIINRVLPDRDVSLLLWVAAGLSLATLASLAAAYGEFLFGAVFRERMTLRLQKELLEHVQRLPLRFFRQHDEGYMMGRILSDSGQAVDYAAGLTSSGRSLVWLLAATLLVPHLHLGIGLGLLAILPLYGLVLWVFNQRIRDEFGVVQERSALVSRELHQTLAGIAETKAYRTERHRERRFVRALIDRMRALVRGRHLMALAGHSTKAVALAVSLFILVLGGLDVIRDRLTLGELVALNALAGYLLLPVGAAVQHVLQAQKSLASIERIEEILATSREVDGGRCAPPAKLRTGHVRFEKVSFAFDPERPLLVDVDLEIRPGETVLLVGPNGAGKTTLASLIPRFYEPNSGRILLDGVPIRSLPLRDLRRRVAFVSQDTFLFSESIRDNIRLGRRSATTEEVMEAARRARVLDFAAALPAGVETRVGERGCRLSGGQRQRVAIARALLADASILILDEASSAVDRVAESGLHAALAEATADRTTLVIAHHASSFIERVDRTLLLEDGRLRPVPVRLVREAVAAAGVPLSVEA